MVPYDLIVKYFTSPNAQATGDPHSRGESTAVVVDDHCRRASFFGPSPPANLVGVEEGHPVTAKVPFFVGPTRATHVFGTGFVRSHAQLAYAHSCLSFTDKAQYVTERRYTMSDIVVPELARVMYEDRVRDAERINRFSSYRRPSRLLTVLRSLLLPLIRS